MIRPLVTIIFAFIFIRTTNADGLCDFFEQTAINVSEPCLKQMHTVCNNPLLTWQLYDASSKLFTSGMTYTNVIDYGNFPECLSINYHDEDETILGKFCGFSHIIFDIPMTPQALEVLDKFGIDTEPGTPKIVSMETFVKMERQLRDVLISDFPFVISKYSSCVPDACTPQEVGHYYWYGTLLGDFIPLIVYTNVITCETVNSNTDFEGGDIAVITVFALIGCLMVISTIYDAWCQNFSKKPYHPLFIAFSVLYNGKKLLAISNNTTEQVQCFNGMRFISMCWVVSYHAASVPQAGLISLENYPEAKEWSEKISRQYIESALLAVDTFLFIAGFLLIFTYLKTATEKTFLQQLTGVPTMYLHRYLRLTPSVAAMYLVTITFFRLLGSGPTWSMITFILKDSCKNLWWKFFLYIQNYTDPDGMCVNPTWYLSADMQMFILAPLVIIPVALFIKKSFRAVMYGLVGLTILSILVPMLTRYYVDNENPNIYATHDRFNNFLIGIMFGATMRMYKHKPYIFSPLINVVLWIVVLVVSLAFNLYWFDVLYNYDILKFTLFGGFYRPVWCCCLVFMVYSCYHNHGGIVQWFLTLPSFQILGKLSYSMYIIHFLVEVYAGGTLKTSSYFSNYTLFYNFCGHLIVTLVLSVVWVLAFEYPMLTIDTYIQRMLSYAGQKLSNCFDMFGQKS